MKQFQQPLNEYPTTVAVEIIQTVRSLYKKYPSEKKLFKDILDKLFRRASDRIMVRYASEDAIAFAQKHSIDLATLTWDKQTKYDPERKILHFEHCFPLKELIDRCLETNEDPKTITHDNFVAWITKDENARLDACGFNHARPNGWEKCYAACGIKIKPLQ